MLFCSGELGGVVKKRGIPEGGTTEDMPRKFLTTWSSKVTVVF